MAHTSITLQRGFTLIEMLIVLAIIGAVTAVVVTGQNSFERSVILTNTTYDIALSIREAQAFGFSGKSANNTIFGTGNYAYGVDFDMSTLSTKKYVLFADNSPQSYVMGGCHKSPFIPDSPNQKTGDCFFSKGASGDIVSRDFTIRNGVTISKVCIYSTVSGVNCVTNNSGSGQLDISFTRPNRIYVSLGTKNIKISGNTACIKVSRLGVSRYILVRGYGSSPPYEAGTVSVSNKPVALFCSSIN